MTPATASAAIVRTVPAATASTVRVRRRRWKGLASLRFLMPVPRAPSAKRPAGALGVSDSASERQACDIAARCLASVASSGACT